MGKRKQWVFAACLGALAFILVSLVATKRVYDAQFPRYDRPDEALSARFSYQDIEDEYPRTVVRFGSGRHTLQGYMYGAEHTRALVVVAHGLGGGADSQLSQIMHFVDNGYMVFSYDCTGSYDSEGASTKGFVQSVLDLHAALTHLESRSDLASLPLILFGHSWGGYAVANVLHYNHDIQAVISVSGVNKAMDIVIEHGKQSLGWFIHTQYPFLWLYQHLLFGRAASFDAISAINASDIPVLIIHGTQDEMVGCNTSSILAASDDITNPNVRTISCSTEGRNGHNNLFLTDEAIVYIDEVNTVYRSLFDSYEGTIPYEQDEAFYSGLDKTLINALEPTLMSEIDAWMDQVLSVL